VNESEIIVHKCSSDDEFKLLSQRAFQYALISLPFTVDRMKLRNIKSRILNIYKGKLAEGLLENFALQNQLKIDFEAGESGFWTRDLFDFSYRGIEWDLKNNFTHAQEALPPGEYLNLPALVPNRHQEDQWQKAQKSDKKGFLFSFMTQNEFPNQKQIKLSGAQTEFVKQLNTGDVDRNEKPFQESWFFEELEKRGPKPQIEHSQIPNLVITGYCLPEHYAQFLDTDGIDHFNYAMFGGKWYTLDDKNRLNFRGGLIRTRIRNATCPIAALPSFKSFISASEK